MHSLLSEEAFAALGDPELVYVRPVRAKEVMGDVTPQTIAHFSLTPEALLYAVHRANGERLAVLMDKEAAFAAAFAHELVPVSVH